ncbi:MAG: hypothetical protein KBA31_04770 [Alphaproteobacteria bacterium]|nr:hypothetical protein [Alphaproteobacteria bacterium]
MEFIRQFKETEVSTETVLKTLPAQKNNRASGIRPRPIHASNVGDA